MLWSVKRYRSYSQTEKLKIRIINGGVFGKFTGRLRFFRI